MAPIFQFFFGKVAFRRLPHPFRFRHRDREFFEERRDRDGLPSFAQKPFGVHSGELRYASSEFEYGRFRKPFRVILDRVPKISRLRRGNEHVFAVPAFSVFVFVPLVAPCQEPFGSEVSDIVHQMRPIGLHRSQPNADVFGTDAFEPGFLYPVREASAVRRKFSAHGFERRVVE